MTPDPTMALMDYLRKMEMDTDADFLREAVRFFPHLREEMLRIILVSSGKVILPELGEELGTYAHRKLTEQKIEVHSNCKVTAVTDREVVLSDGTTVTTNTLVWTAGVSPHPLLDTLPGPKENGRVLVNEYLEVPGWPGLWAFGDCALVPDPKTGKPHPPTAQHALRSPTPRPGIPATTVAAGRSSTRTESQCSTQTRPMSSRMQPCSRTPRSAPSAH